MLEFLLFVIGACGVAISIFANIAIGQCGDTADAERAPEADKPKQRLLFGKPGRNDAEVIADS
ncbi:hypothetical protein [Collimonas pratensis]|uniref:Lipoprotein n=1 Tax=Collimonas pratensis TaxID=279113 RepID=A0ABN4MDT1_9BURK|nr:hypothetical protein [Collimonas pratensis]AMP15368.1 hypothetical protein CPter291_3131 [Collimonas pratensis]